MSLAVMEQSSGTITIAHTFGTIEVPLDAVMRFVSPMWGFEDCTEFALVPAARQGLWWFIATGETPTTFVLADPFVAIDDYAIDLSEGERDELGLQDEHDAFALVLLAMPARVGDPVKANLRAPLVFNLTQRKVKQVVNRDDRHPLDQVVDLARYPASDAGVSFG